MSKLLTFGELADLRDEAERKGDWPEENSLRYRMKTICSNCEKEGADDHYDQHGIYAGRWHERCATPGDRHRENYHWQPGDEPLEED